jgi:hypothetical protein
LLKVYIASTSLSKEFEVIPLRTTTAFARAFGKGGLAQRFAKIS